MFGEWLDPVAQKGEFRELPSAECFDIIVVCENKKGNEMTQTFKVEFSKKVPIVEAEGAKWMVDTGCPISSPNFEAVPKMKEALAHVGEFLGIQGVQIMGLDYLGDYILVDYRNKTIINSEEPIAFEGTTVPMVLGMHGCPCVEMTVGGKAQYYHMDTGAAYSYVHGLDKTAYEPAGTAEECDLHGALWFAPVFRVPCEFQGHAFEIVCGAAADNKTGVPPADFTSVRTGGVIGYDFFNSFAVLINRRAKLVTFRPVVKTAEE